MIPFAAQPKLNNPLPVPCEVNEFPLCSVRLPVHPHACALWCVPLHGRGFSQRRSGEFDHNATIKKMPQSIRKTNVYIYFFISMYHGLAA